MPEARVRKGPGTTPGPPVSLGFLVLDHLGRLEEALSDLGQWVRDGRLAYAEDIVEGLENAPEALIRLLAGQNTGKMIVKVGAEPA